MMVITGDPESISERPEFLDILNPNACYKEISDHPFDNLKHAVGGIVNDRPMICGGYTNEYPTSGDRMSFRNECFTLSDEGKWIQHQ